MLNPPDETEILSMRQQWILWINSGSHLEHSCPFWHYAGLVCDYSILEIHSLIFEGLRNMQIMFLISDSEQYLHSHIFRFEITDIEYNCALQFIGFRKIVRHLRLCLREHGYIFPFTTDQLLPLSNLSCHLVIICKQFL